MQTIDRDPSADEPKKREDVAAPVLIEDVPEERSTTRPSNGSNHFWPSLVTAGILLLIIGAIGAPFMLQIEDRPPAPQAEPTPQLPDNFVPTPLFEDAPIRDEYHLTITEASGTIYASTGPGETYAFAQDGKLLWHSETKGRTNEQPRVINGIVYVTTNPTDSTFAIYALQASDGKQLWTYQDSDYGYLSAIADGVAYIVSSEGIKALRASNGTQIWSFASKDLANYSLQFGANGIVYGQVESAIDGASTSIYAWQASDGKVLWQQSVEQGAYLQNMLDGVLYVALPGGKLDALRVSDGNRLWSQTPLAGNVRLSVVAVDAGVAYITAQKYSLETTSSSSQTGFAGALNQLVLNIFAPTQPLIPQKMAGEPFMLALRVADGSVLWSRPLTTDQLAGWVGSTGVQDGKIYVWVNSFEPGGDEQIYALKAADGSEIWRYESSMSTDFVRVMGGTLYILSGGGGIYALNAHDGSRLWYSRINGPLYGGASISITDSTLYTGSSGVLYAIDIWHGTLRWQYVMEDKP